MNPATRTVKLAPVNGVDDDFYLEIESHFAARRGTPFVFSAKDWALMRSWREEGVPLAVVIEAIDGCFDKQATSGRKRVISSLSYCRHAVREIWADRKELHVGGAAAVPEADALALLTDLASRLEDAAQRVSDAAAAVLRSTAARLAPLAASSSIPQIEEKLLEIEDEMIGAFVDAVDPAMLADIERDVDAELAHFSVKNAKTLQRTRAANVRRLLRKRADLPRLSLFA